MQTDEHPLVRAAGGGPTAERAAEAQRRALDALAQMIPGDDGSDDDMAPHAFRGGGYDTEEGGPDGPPAHEIVIDLTGDAHDDHRWATAAKTARLAGVPTSTVRQWARRGVIRRRHRDEGGYVVDVEAALDAAIHAGPSGEAPAGHILAKIMQLQRDRALEEMQHVDREVEEAVVEIEFLRHQLDFAAAENRGLRVSLDKARQDLLAARSGFATTQAGTTEEDPAADAATDGPPAPPAPTPPTADSTPTSPAPAEQRLSLPHAVFDVLRGDDLTPARGGIPEQSPAIKDDMTPADVERSSWRRRVHRRR